MRTILLLAAVTLALAACGGGGSDSGGAPNPGGGTATEVQAFFIDDVVEGLQYQVAGGAVRTTDKYGVFRCIPSSQVTFLVDGIPLGTVSCLNRITPSNFGSSGANIARFLQSLDTTPGVPGIRLVGVDLPPTPINFMQPRDNFSADVTVLAAVAAAAFAGGSGVLVSEAAALSALRAGTSTSIVSADFANVALYPVSAGIVNEPCFVLLRANFSGLNVCQDDIDENPATAVQEFTWSVTSATSGLVVEYSAGAGVEERVTVQRLGTTGNRISADVVSECLVCDPNAAPTIITERQTLITALPITANDFSGVTLKVTGSGAGNTVTIAFDANGTTGSWDDATTPPRPFLWSIDPATEMLILRGTGIQGAQLLYHHLILLEGTASAVGTSYAAVLAHGTDTGGNGVLDAAEFDANGIPEAVTLLAVIP